MSLTPEILQLSQQLKQERLFVNSERQLLLKLNEEIKNSAEQLFHDLWKSKQQRTFLHQLTHAHVSEAVKPIECCSRVSQLDRVNFVDSYHYLSYHDIRIVELLKNLRENPHLLAHCIVVCEEHDAESARDLINVSLSCIYGNCLIQYDEIAVLQMLQTLMHLKLINHNDPRKLLRKTSLSFSVAFKQLFDILFSARLFLTAAIHDPVMRLLMEDEWFYDIDPDKAVVRFPKAERIRRFGEIGTDEYSTKHATYRKFIVDKLVILTNHFIQSIKNNMHCFPSSLAWLISQIYHALCKRDALTIEEIRILCTDLVFSLFICPAICDPEPHGITSDIPISHIARHNLMQIAQIIQILALYRCDDDIDMKLRDLYSRFDKDDMRSVLDTILEGPILQLPSQSTTVLSQQDFCRSAMLLTHTQLMRLIGTLRNISSLFPDDSDEGRQLRDMIGAIPTSVGQMTMPRSVGLGTTPPGTPQTPHKRTSGPGTPLSLRKGKSHKKIKSLSPSRNDPDPEDGTSSEGSGSGLEDVLVLTVEPERQCVGMLSEHKVLSSEEDNRLNGQPIVEIQEKRTRFSLSQDQESIGNNSDNQEAVSEAASSHSVGSVDLENDNDNFSDMLSANVSGRGTPSISGRDTPLSQVEGDRVVRVATPKAESDNMGDMFGKFEIKAELESEAKSTVSDTWSTDVIASDSEPPEQNHLERLEEVTEEFVRQHLLKGPDICETASDAWSTDVLASDTEDKQSEFTDIEQPDLERDDLSGIEGASVHSVEIRVMDSLDNAEDRSRDFSDVGSGIELPAHSISSDSFMSEANAEITPPYNDPDISIESEAGFEVKSYFTKSDSPSSEKHNKKPHRRPRNRDDKSGRRSKDSNVARKLSDVSIDENVDEKWVVVEGKTMSDNSDTTSKTSSARNVPDLNVMGVNGPSFKNYVPSEKSADVVVQSSVTKMEVAPISAYHGGARPKLSIIRQGGPKNVESKSFKISRGRDLLGEASSDDIIAQSSSKNVESKSYESDRQSNISREASTDEIVENIDHPLAKDNESESLKLSRGSELLTETSTDDVGSRPLIKPKPFIDNMRSFSDASSRDFKHQPLASTDVRPSSYSSDIGRNSDNRDARNSGSNLVKDRLISSSRFSGEARKSGSRFSSSESVNTDNKTDKITVDNYYRSKTTRVSGDTVIHRHITTDSYSEAVTSTPTKGRVGLGDLPQTDSGIAEMEASLDEAETSLLGDSLKLSEQQNTKLDSKRLSTTLNMYDPVSPEMSGISTNSIAEVAASSANVVTSLFVETRPRNDSSGSSQSATSLNPRDGSPSQSETSSLKSDDKGDDECRVEKKKGIFNKMKERFHKGMLKKGAKDRYDDVFSQKNRKSEPNIVVTETSDDILDKYRKKVVLAAGDSASDTDVSNPQKSRLSSKDDTSSDSAPLYDPNNLENCFAFHDAKRKLRLVLSTGDFNIGVGVADFVTPRSVLMPIVTEGSDNRENDLVKLLKTQLAEALNLQNKDLIAQLHEGIRCVRVFDNAACKKLLKCLRCEYKSRSAYISYLVRCRQGLLLSSSHLEQLHKRVLRDKEIVSKHFTNVCVRLFLETRERPVLKFMSDFQKLTVSDEKTDLVERFLQYLHQQVNSDPMWNAVGESQQADARLAIERVIMSRIYTHAMFPNGDGDVYRDQILQQHIKKISLTITPQHKDLCIPRTYHHECPWPAAQREIYMINAYKTPKDKLQCVLRSATTIMNLLSMASDKSIPAADDFVPVFIYVIIKANPPCLLSTIQYVNSFYENRLAGEEHYWWMQFISAVEFIKTMD